MTLTPILNDWFPSTAVDGKREWIACSGFNIIMHNEHVDPNDQVTLFGDQPVHLAHDADMYDLLVATGCFLSKGQASKNWTKTGKQVPLGWSEWLFGKGKAKKVGLFIWNPVKFSEAEGEHA